MIFYILHVDIINEASHEAKHSDIVVEAIKVIITLLTNTTLAWQERIKYLTQIPQSNEDKSIFLSIPTLILPHEPTIAWLVHRWSASYLFVDPKNYGPRSYAPRRLPLSASLQSCCASTSNTAPHRILEALVTFVSVAICVSTPIVKSLRNLNTLLFERCTILLGSLVEKNSIRRIVFRNKCNAWTALIDAFTRQSNTSIRNGTCVPNSIMTEFSHMKQHSLRGLPSLFHREWTAALCSSESPSKLVHVAVALQAYILDAIKRIHAEFENGCAKHGMHSKQIQLIYLTVNRLQQMRGLVLTVTNTSSRGATKVINFSIWSSS